jgi:hypothetical protein
MAISHGDHPLTRIERPPICNPGTQSETTTMNTATTTSPVSSTEEVFKRHLQAFAEGLDALVSDYTDESCILLADRRISGVPAIRKFFADFLQSIQPGFWEAFKVERNEVQGEVAYLVWSAKPFVPLATDTLHVKNGKILVQTFTVLA